MNGKNGNHRIYFAGLLGAALISSSPLLAQADQGKWWNPEERRPAREQRVERDRRGDDRGDRVAGRGDRRDVRAWRGTAPRYQRDIVVWRGGPRDRSIRAHRIWIRPLYFHRRHLCVLRPVRYFVGADALIGDVRLRLRLHDRDGYYGCNFCDARFGDFDSYHQHVLRCDDRPHGYRFEVSDWDDE